VRTLPHRRVVLAGALKSRQFCPRLARCGGAHSGIWYVWFTARRSTATRACAAAQSRWTSGTFLHAGESRHGGAGISPPPPALSDGAGLRLSHCRCVGVVTMKTSRRAPLQAPTAGLVLHTNLTLIEVADPLLLEELRADRRLAPLLVAQLSDR